MAEMIVDAPMAGRVIRLHVEGGSQVQQDDRICDMEALKMEIPITAPASGTIKTVCVSAGQVVEGGDPLAVLEAS